MEIGVDKKLGTLVHIYDYLNGGYFSAHHQLQYYNEKAYQMYINNNKDGLFKLYNHMKVDVPCFILSIIETKPGIRYFCCDGCHDAEILDAYFDGEYLSIFLNTNGMLGCLNVENSCIVKIKTKTYKTCKKIIDNVTDFNKLYWLYSDILFNDGLIIFKLELQAFSETSYENFKYEFDIEDIVIN